MKQKRSNSISALSALLMLAVFALCILGALLGGAKVYAGMTARSESAYHSRTCLQYFATKVRQAPGDVQITQFGDGDALFLYERLGSREYVTRIYCHNGWLMELYTLNTDGFAPEDGEKLLPLSSLTITADGSLLTFTAVVDEVPCSIRVSLCGGEVVS